MNAKKINLRAFDLDFAENFGNALANTIAGMKEYYSDTGSQIIKETIKEYSPSGTLWSVGHFVIDADDLLDHVKAAKKRRFTIDVTDDSVTITRTMNDGSKYVVSYVPVSA